MGINREGIPMNIWFFSDSHYGHFNIVRGVSDWFDNPQKSPEDFSDEIAYQEYLSGQKRQIEATRDFNTVEEHDEYLLNEVNKVVKSADSLYHLGDFGLGIGLRDRLPELRRRINCETIYLAKGNHDHLFEEKNRKKYPGIFDMFKDIRDIYYKKINNRFFVLGHYSMRTWPWQHHKSINLYGHSHGNLPDDPNSLSMDVGVDTCLFGHKKYTPYSIDEIFHIMDNFKKFVAVDHHK